MKRALYLVLTSVSLMALSGCAFESEETGDSSESVEGVQQAFEGNPHESLLAALGSATLECLGTARPGLYAVDTKSGNLVRKFDACGGKNGSAVLKQIDSLLGVQNSKVGQGDGLSSLYTKTWSTYEKNFPKGVECGTYTRSGVINPPTWDSVKQQQGQVSKENYTYYVQSKQCGKDTECAVKNALICAGGFGSQFLISGDPKTSQIKVDPAWWLTTYEFGEDASNPFMTPGYYHAMSYYGSAPGAMYGAIQREGEACSRWSEISGKHYTDSKLIGIDCGGGWYCMAYCY